MMMASCGTGFGTTGNGSTGSILGDVLNGVVNGGGIDAIASIIGATKMTQQSILGSWKYSGPGCAFTSEKLLAKAGGEVVAAQIKQKMLPTYQTLGLYDDIEALGGSGLKDYLSEKINHIYHQQQSL